MYDWSGYFVKSFLLLSLQKRFNTSSTKTSQGLQLSDSQSTSVVSGLYLLYYPRTMPLICDLEIGNYRKINAIFFAFHVGSIFRMTTVDQRPNALMWISQQNINRLSGK